MSNFPLPKLAWEGEQKGSGRSGPQRIVCLTGEPAEALYAIGESDCMFGISGFTVGTPRAQEKAKVSAFTSATIGEILKLGSDFSVGVSDIQADIACELACAGDIVWNHFTRLSARGRNVNRSRNRD